ncbi:hypothetical protein SMICM17S_06068 [Streptomyces microflavus]
MIPAGAIATVRSAPDRSRDGGHSGTSPAIRMCRLVRVALSRIVHTRPVASVNEVSPGSAAVAVSMFTASIPSIPLRTCRRCRRPRARRPL